MASGAGVVAGKRRRIGDLLNEVKESLERKINLINNPVMAQNGNKLICEVDNKMSSSPPIPIPNGLTRCTTMAPVKAKRQLDFEEDMKEYKDLTPEEQMAELRYLLAEMQDMAIAYQACHEDILDLCVLLEKHPILKNKLPDLMRNIKKLCS